MLSTDHTQAIVTYPSLFSIKQPIKGQFSVDQKALKENIKHISRYKFNVTPYLLEYLKTIAKTITKRVFDDYYYYPDMMMKKNVWIKKRVENGQEEWIIKQAIESENDFQYLEERYTKNPIAEPPNEVARSSINRDSYYIDNSSEAIIINIDRVTFPEGDVSCCGSFDNYSTQTTLPNIMEYTGTYAIRSTLFEYLYRYNPTLYLDMENIYSLNTTYITCILPDQYEDMEKKGDEEYFRLLSIIQGVNWYTKEELTQWRKRSLNTIKITRNK